MVEPSCGIDTKESVGDKILPIGDVQLSAVGEPAAMDEELAAVVDGPAAVGAWHEPSGGVGVVPSAVGESQQHNPEALPPVRSPVLSPKRLHGYTIICIFESWELW